MKHARFISRHYGTVQKVMVNGESRLLDKPAPFAPGQHWQLTYDGLWFCAEDWTPLILYAFAKTLDSPTRDSV